MNTGLDSTGASATRLRIALVAGLAVAGLTALGAPAAGAATTAVGAGALDWGVKESFRNYVEGSIANGSITTSDGATRNEDGTFRWPLTGGEYDSTTETGVVYGKGTVRFYGHSGQLEMLITDPWVAIDGEAGVLYADVESRTLGDGSLESYPDVDFAALDLSGVAPTLSATGFGYADVPATLTENGAPAFADFYEPGTELDPLTVNAEYGSSAAVDAPVLEIPDKKQKLNRNRRARIARVVCNTGPCSVEVKDKVAVRIAGDRHRLKVKAPGSVAADETAKIEVKLDRKAAEHLSGHTAKVKLPITVTVAGGSEYSSPTEVSERAKVKIKA